MEIERINEHTVKFFISYVDVEERGFDRDEIWYNREKSEELFWEMMDEVHEEEDFAFDGPLWIQVQALEKGLEVLVTKAQLSKDGAKYEFPFPDDKMKDHFSADERIEELLDHHFHYKTGEVVDDFEDDSLSFIAYFQDFEDLINLAKREWPEQLETKLYAFDNKYYLYMEFPFDEFTEEDIDDAISIILEYATESQSTIHYLNEYGKLVMDKNVFSTIKKHFLKNK